MCSKNPHRSTSRTLRALKRILLGKISKHWSLSCVTKEKELFEMQDEDLNDKTESSYDKLKTDCLVFVNGIQEKAKRNLSQ